jgi:predicted lipoprotein with Yx(FWY)xxD motif
MQRRLTRMSRPGRLGALAVLTALTAAACGGAVNAATSTGGYGAPPASATSASASAAPSSSASASAASGSAPAAAAPSATQHADMLRLGSTGLGSILTDGTGRTVYLFEKDAGTTSTCYGACAGYWPPVTTAGAPGSTGGLDATMLGTSMRSDGSRQVTYAGHPLYYFAGDRQPGSTQGEGLKNFGGGWYVLDAHGVKIDRD